MKRMASVAVAGIVAFIIFAIAGPPLRNYFHINAPHICAFLPFAARASRNTVIVVGLLFSIRFIRDGHRSSRMLAAGFGCLIAASLVRSLWYMWALANPVRFTPQAIDPSVPVWVYEWYAWLNAPELLAAVGFVLLIMAIVSRWPDTRTDVGE
jgi:hypothetical protein